MDLFYSPSPSLVSPPSSLLSSPPFFSPPNSRVSRKRCYDEICVEDLSIPDEFRLDENALGTIGRSPETPSFEGPSLGSMGISRPSLFRLNTQHQQQQPQQQIQQIQQVQQVQQVQQPQQASPGNYCNTQLTFPSPSQLPPTSPAQPSPTPSLASPPPPSPVVSDTTPVVEIPTQQFLNNNNNNNNSNSSAKSESCGSPVSLQEQKSIGVCSPREELNVQDYKEMLAQARDVICGMSDTISQLKSRIEQLENDAQQAQMCSSVSECSDDSNKSHVTTTTTPSKPDMMTPSVAGLRLSQNLETVWYADRPFPAFTVELYDTLSGNLMSNVTGVKVQLSLLDGFGNDATDKLTTAHHTPNTPLTFTLTEGSVSISGLRFASVSSKCGGTFRVVFTVTYTVNDLEVITTPDSPLSSGCASPGPYSQCSVTSPPIQILSYRLYHCRKLALDKLTPNDNIAKMRGIGALYGKRLEGLGVVSVRDLAELQIGDGMSVEDERRVMTALRRDRGAMTMTKLVEYVNQARQIVERHLTKQVNDTPPKRRRVSGPSSVSPTQVAEY